MYRIAFVLLGAAALLAAQKYAGPRPPKPDVPYLVHADNLLAAETSEAKEETRKDDTFYIVAGASSPVRTPLASPIFLMQAGQLAPERLQLFKLDPKNGRREILFSRKKKPMARPIMLTVSRLGADNLFRIEVVESLQNGEYSLTPDGSNQVFCFQVY
jgi:hypothetical protein